MIRNVVFDLGRVLICYDPLAYIRDMGYSEEKADQLLDRIFLHPFWNDFDRGVYDMARMREVIGTTYPDIREDVNRILQPYFFDLLEIKKDTEEFLRSLKTQGYKIYFLSNFSQEGFAYMERKFDFLQLGDGKIISGYVGYNKPEPEIYRLLLDTYELTPAETVFIDDMPINVESAAKFGMQGIVFANAEDVKEKFHQLCKA